MIWSYILIIILIAFSAVFSGSEISYASSSEVKLRKNAEEKKSVTAKTAYDIFINYDKTLIAILVGNNLVNIGSSSVATVIAVGLIGDSGAAAATFVMTLLILTFGEILPKIIASRIPEKFATFVSVPIKIVMFVTYPVVWCVNLLLGKLSKLWEGNKIQEAVTEDDLETMLETVEDEGVIDEDTCDLLQSALDFDDVLAYEIITPRVDILAIDVDDDAETIMKTIMNSAYSRIPVYQDTIDNIIGLVHQNPCLRKLADGQQFDIKELFMKPQFVHKTMPLPDVLKIMKKTQCHMVIVTDEYGGTMGLITMEDVLEQLVGEIWDEKDVIDEEFVELGKDVFEADGDMRIYDFFEELDIDDKDFDDDNSTLGGWAIEMLGGYPKKGDTFDYKNLTITVKDLRNMRVLSLLVKVNHVPEEEEN